MKRPLQKYAHLTGQDDYLSSHLKTKFHENSVTKACAFIAMVKSGKGSVAEQMDTEAARQKETNRNNLKQIIFGIEFLGRLVLPLRGHRDSGELPMPNEENCSSGSAIDYTQGNFRATLQLMIASGDKILKEHIAGAAKNASYISPKNQNQLIDSISTTFEQFIVDQIKQAKYFSILADETTDNSRNPQLSLCLRYVHENEICERFVCFAELEDFSGQGIAKQILSILAEIGLDIDCMVGQGYDGAAAMSGIKNDVQKHVRDVCSSAVYTHCAAHSLNLCLLKAAEIPEI